ncbi:hypothetical protein [Gordonia sp. CPCC 205333]|uniref:hypothetical protein n=1 Tax=Gordonia sp. CPCC 205333 TaxID=3140790 RepID=UPI003AF3AD30
MIAQTPTTGILTGVDILDSGDGPAADLTNCARGHTYPPDQVVRWPEKIHTFLVEL